MMPAEERRSASSSSRRSIASMPWRRSAVDVRNHPSGTRSPRAWPPRWAARTGSGPRSAARASVSVMRPRSCAPAHASPLHVPPGHAGQGHSRRGAPLARCCCPEALTPDQGIRIEEVQGSGRDDTGGPGRPLRPCGGLSGCGPGRGGGRGVQRRSFASSPTTRLRIAASAGRWSARAGSPRRRRRTPRASRWRAQTGDLPDREGDRGLPPPAGEARSGRSGWTRMPALR